MNFEFYHPMEPIQPGPLVAFGYSDTPVTIESAKIVRLDSGMDHVPMHQQASDPQANEWFIVFDDVPGAGTSLDLELRIKLAGVAGMQTHTFTVDPMRIEGFRATRILFPPANKTLKPKHLLSYGNSDAATHTVDPAATSLVFAVGGPVVNRVILPPRPSLWMVKWTNLPPGGTGGTLHVKVVGQDQGSSTGLTVGQASTSKGMC